MNYEQAIEYINSFLVFGSKLGLDRITNLLKKLGEPQKKLKFIHVAGTNGKGSICAYTESILRTAGFKTGMFISPYIVDFCERFQINGKMIEHDELCKFTSRVKQVVDTLSDDEIPTEFELITAIGYLYFAENNCDVVVLEVGLGGRFDSTNTIDTPLCSVIASISLDHTAILGDTVEKIAYEKAGIIKENGVTVVYPDIDLKALKVIEGVCREKHNKLVKPDSFYTVCDTAIDGDTVRYGDYKFKLGIAGVCQPLNAICAIETVKQSGLGVCCNSFVYGIESTRFPARIEVVHKNPTVIVDGAHNPDGVKSLESVVKAYMKNPSAVIGMMEDKDIDSVLKDLAPLFSKIYTVTVDNPRSISAEKLAEKAKKYCNNVVSCENPSQAIEKAMLDDDFCVCGSFYLCGQIYNELKEKLEK